MNPIAMDVLYGASLLAASPWFLYKMVTTGKYRAGLKEKLGFIPARIGSDCIWLHGVSVGELLAARGIVSALEEALPDEEIVLSTTTNTGREVAEKNYPGKRVFYYPLDFSRAVRRAFARTRPRLVVLMEMEVWPNFLRRANALGVPVVVANGRITERAYRRWKRFPSTARSILGGVTLYMLQTDAYAERLISLGVPEERIIVTGSVKFDTINTGLDASRRDQLRREMGVADDEILIIGGSTHAGEEETLLGAYGRLKIDLNRLRLLIVPRHKTRFSEVARLMRIRGYDVIRKSAPPAAGRASGSQVILGDTMGELADLYRAADVAFVGGSLVPRGGQNMLEPAAVARPVIFGPYVENFPQASKLLLDAGAATQISAPEELTAAVRAYLDPDAANNAGAAGRKALIAAQGATARTVEAIKEILENRARGT
ncbi:MAG: 3-deoxy-D-manno-octulosonic acid transferase [Planctomycetes bacterium]|nr:3-deoxy-D-manno-octulosonic acid transferase [Planctomycetota bacterium]